MNNAAEIKCRDDAGALTQSDFLDDVLKGLLAPGKSLPCRWFYDAAGAALFDQITGLPEYYLTRTETALLKAHAKDIWGSVGIDRLMVEFGAGSGQKSRIMLDANPELSAYVPVDISADYLYAFAASLAGDYPDLSVYPCLADFSHPFNLPPDLDGQPVLGFFPGSTIGNFERDKAVDFMRGAGAILGAGSSFLVGADLQKDVGRLLAAYDDAAGVTARFNLNLLERINRDLSGNFNPGAFHHEARYNSTLGRVEMYLISDEAQTVTLSGQQISFAEGGEIHTENSHKYTVDGFQTLATEAGWSTEAVFMDEMEDFALFLLSSG